MSDGLILAVSGLSGVEDEGHFCHAVREGIGDFDPGLAIDQNGIGDGSSDVEIGRVQFGAIGIDAGIGLGVDGADDDGLAG
jgi:hypothetical protein